jgi:hypothetical protein
VFLGGDWDGFSTPGLYCLDSRGLVLPLGKGQCVGVETRLGLWAPVTCRYGSDAGSASCSLWLSVGGLSLGLGAPHFCQAAAPHGA